MVSDKHLQHIHDINSTLFSLQTALPLLEDPQGINKQGQQLILALSMEKLDKLADSWHSLKSEL
ncbi:MAG: hypothetical protein HN353_04145 [Bdellovibrionales bacterium]|jgi:hypothetical protein|nr:hypothetical protein [Bdellovibrionales bacterium]MBT3526526.1 hypothetical protein [Bdellovibrionales bacterium]MBT7668240.1 hypothetical protein [Bdellovibrionales bacterium]MBT7768143.1 hypothetical protein [Bdellovibrionales bacterium]